MGYTGTSVVDYVNSTGADSSYANRTTLAAQNGITNYTGSAAQNTQLLGILNQPAATTGSSAFGTPTALNNFTSLVKQSAPLPATTAPTNVANVQTGVTSPVIPTVQSSTGNISSATAATAGASTFYDQQAKQQQQIAADAKAESDRLRAESAAQAKPFLDKLLGAKAPSQVRAETAATTGINPAQYFADEKAKISEIDSLSQDYNKAVAAKDAQVAALTGQGRGIPIDYLNNQAAQIERNAAPKLNEMSANINSKTAVLQATRGMFQEAQTYINQAVQDATADTKFNFDMYNAFYDINKDAISRLDATYQTAIKNSRDDAESAHLENFNLKTKIGDLLINNPRAGITMSDTYDQALAKAAANPGTSLDDQYKQAQINNLNNEIANRNADNARLSGASGGGTTGFDDVMQAAIDQGATPLEAARAAAAVSEQSGIQVDQATLSKWTTRAQTFTKTIAPAVATPAPAPLSPIEKQIAQLKQANILTNADIRQSLSRTYTQDEINKSSVASPIDVVGSFFSNLFGS